LSLSVGVGVENTIRRLLNMFEHFRPEIEQWAAAYEESRK